MDKEFIKELIKLVSSSSLTKFKLKTKDLEIKIEKEIPNALATPEVEAKVTQKGEFKSEKLLPPAEDVETPEEKLHVIKSPLVGTFYRAPAPGAPPFVEEGDIVSPGQVLCIIEALKVMNEIESDVKGKVVKILVENGQPVEYGQPLFLIDTNV
ncbi:MAG TPA: acetyl-CoA carboxylase biotin carboxyl carrier protein [Aquificales bacterium]|uniref:Biotin carboxyl carrier protein of acetyl-CoA carboxylase n=1 Tax=Aquifex aeolicus TaxID=63363 RepID=A0A9D0YN96_AQUAO|nr:acetyl-CoA carboxylase biotin carboxyl carrier protein [Aquificales bacterium]HIP97833.1 acetyl-CoA carboxylase biotin carboxyl carrier protein [Aquifex aeolicus]